MDCQLQNNNIFSLNQYCEKEQYKQTDFIDNFNNLRITSSEHMLNQISNPLCYNNTFQSSFSIEKRVIEHLEDLEIKQTKSSTREREENNTYSKHINIESIKEKEEEYFKEENNMFNSNKSLDSMILVQEFNKLEKIYTENSLLHKVKFKSNNNCPGLENTNIKSNIIFEEDNFKEIKDMKNSRNVSSMNTQNSSQENCKNNDAKLGFFEINGKNQKEEKNKNDKNENFQETDLEALNDLYFGKYHNEKESLLKNKLNSETSKIPETNNNENDKKDKNNENYEKFQLKNENKHKDNFFAKKSAVPNIKDFFDLVSF
jgi:hypothetical protein